MARQQEGLSFYKRRKKIGTAFIREIFSWLAGIVIAVFLALVLNYFWGLSTNVIGDSMEPVLYNGQRILIDRFLYLFRSPKPGDVVVFLPNGNENSHYYVKRVVAVPGDTVLIEDGVLYVNGEASDLIGVPVLEGGIAANGITLSGGEFFCIGESPGDSEDSRSANIGPVKEADILGKVWFGLPMKDREWGFVR